ncbi:hypothetical protein V5O48_005259 [Marasmius crinis-equi]|uniref:Uncharacterized protein n=1 Tax=Marasmius crinis-equi TaxID=585013 RepID=A0ABR3FMT6_9AGAR
MSNSGSTSHSTVSLRPHPAGPNFTCRSVSAWRAHYMRKGSVLPNLVAHWASIVKLFFLGSRWMDDYEAFCMLESAAILMIREMRATTSQRRLPDVFRSYLKSSRLGSRIIRYLEKSLSLEKRQWFDVSYRKYRWTESIAAILSDWCDSTNIARQQITPPYVQNHLGHPGSHALNRTLEALDQILPFIARPELVFFLSSYDTFLFYLRTIIIPFVDKNRTDRHLLLPRMCGRGFYQHLISHIRRGQLTDAAVTPLFRSIVLRAIEVRDTIQNISNRRYIETCRCSEATPFGENCKRTMLVDRKSAGYLSKLRAKVLWDFENPSEVPLDNGGRPIPSYFLSPEEMSTEFIHVAPRPLVFAKCGRDVTIFKDRETGLEVGGVSYEALGDYLPQIRQNHAHIVASNRQALQRSMNDGGRMICVGNRLGKGGRPGDTYSMYTSTVIDPEDAIDTASRVQDTGSDASAVMEALRNASSYAYHNISRTAKTARTRHLGTEGVSGVYCTNYIAPQHGDRDASFTAAVQLTKQAPSRSHFAFVYSEWGIVIETVSDTLFWFDSDALHGTLTCRRSDLASGASLSEGVGFMVRSRDAEFAKKVATNSLIHLELAEAFD